MRVSDQKNQSTLAIQLRAYMSENKLSQVSVAKSIGLTSSVISTWLGDKYTGDVAGVEEKIRQHLELESERAAQSAEIAGRDVVVRTELLVDVVGALRDLVVAREIGVIVGTAGVGKTTALRAYMTEHPAILIEADCSYTPRTLFAEICETLKLDTRGNIHDLFMRVVDKLADSGRFVIIDEAEHLKYTSLELVRRMADKARIGVALVGMPRLQRNIEGDPGHFAQIYNRVGTFRRFDKLSVEDIDKLILAQVGLVDDDTRSTLRRICKRNARTLTKLTRWCHRLRERNPAWPFDSMLVTEAAKFIMGVSA